MNEKASIIIRTHNEEDWIGHCLDAVRNQTYKNIEIIIVDNKSTDNTLKIAKTFFVDKYVNLKKYLPGKSLNRGNRSCYRQIFSIFIITLRSKK